MTAAAAVHVVAFAVTAAIFLHMDGLSRSSQGFNADNACSHPFGQCLEGLLAYRAADRNDDLFVDVIRNGAAVGRS